MHGKATLILTDKDTGRVVEQIEEHNMVTNALNSIFSLPNEMAFHQESRRNFNGYLPMYKNVLKGLVLFGDNVPENANDYMLGGKYSVLATAGDEYSGSDAMRGTFNSNQSCEIENGYRFVWDFAPEKALGTIKALSLTHRYLGNRGDPALAGADCPYIMHPSDLSGSNNNSVPIISGSGNFFLEKDRRFYSYSTSTGNKLTIRKYRMSDPLALKICDTTSGVLESANTLVTELSLSTSTSRFSYDPITERFYATYHTSTTVNGEKVYRFRYAKINPLTCEKEEESALITTSAPYGTDRCAVYGGKFYLPDNSGNLSVCSLDGALERTINLGAYSILGFLCIDGKLAVICKFSSEGRSCVYFPDEPNTALIYSSYIPIHSSIIRLPYFLTTDSSKVYVMLRTDYLATINNLASPLEKTDQHALQVRYEITN